MESRETERQREGEREKVEMAREDKKTKKISGDERERPADK